MMPSQRLTEVFDRALRQGLQSLTAEEQDLYLIQDFIIEFEMNGLSGYFYNRISEPQQIMSAIAAMRRYGLLDLAAIVQDAFQLFREFTPRNLEDTWSSVLKQCDPENHLAMLEEKILALDNYGLSTSTIS
jgi:hypothetical protein